MYGVCEHAYVQAMDAKTENVNSVKAKVMSKVTSRWQSSERNQATEASGLQDAKRHVKECGVDSILS